MTYSDFHPITRQPADISNWAYTQGAQLAVPSASEISTNPWPAAFAHHHLTPHAVAGSVAHAAVRARCTPRPSLCRTPACLHGSNRYYDLKLGMRANDGFSRPNLDPIHNKLRFTERVYDTSGFSSQGFSWSPSNRYLNRSKLASTRLLNNHISYGCVPWLRSP